MAVAHVSSNMRKRAADVRAAAPVPPKKLAMASDSSSARPTPAVAVPVPMAAAASASAVLTDACRTWQYPTIPPMGLLPPMGMPFMMPGNPFFNPFLMGMMGPAMWMAPALAAAASMQSGFAGGMMQPTAAGVAVPPATMPAWPGMVPSVNTASDAMMVAAARTSSGASSAGFPSPVPSAAQPAAPAPEPPASPLLLVGSPASVCNETGLAGDAEDDEFGRFIDSFLGGGEADLPHTAADLALFDAFAVSSHNSEDSSTEAQALAGLSQSA
jgi:hypothetical protein